MTLRNRIKQHYKDCPPKKSECLECNILYSKQEHNSKFVKKFIHQTHMSTINLTYFYSKEI